MCALPGIMAACGGQKHEPPKNPPALKPAVYAGRLETVRRSVDPSGRDLLLVPSSSVFRSGGFDEVYVVGRDSVVAGRWISIGRSMNGHTVVLGGLDEGEVVVLTPAPGISEGTRITTVKQDRAEEARDNE